MARDNGDDSGDAAGGRVVLMSVCPGGHGDLSSQGQVGHAGGAHVRVQSGHHVCHHGGLSGISQVLGQLQGFAAQLHAWAWSYP